MASSVASHRPGSRVAPDAATISASDGTPNSGHPAPLAIPFAIAPTTRSEVKLPGPAPLTTLVTSPVPAPISASASSTAGK